MCSIAVAVSWCRRHYVWLEWRSWCEGPGGPASDFKILSGRFVPVTRRSLTWGGGGWWKERCFPLQSTHSKNSTSRFSCEIDDPYPSPFLSSPSHPWLMPFARPTLWREFLAARRPLRQAHLWRRVAHKWPGDPLPPLPQKNTEHHKTKGHEAHIRAPLALWKCSMVKAEFVHRREGQGTGGRLPSCSPKSWGKCRYPPKPRGRMSSFGWGAGPSSVLQPKGVHPLFVSSCL